METLNQDREQMHKPAATSLLLLSIALAGAIARLSLPYVGHDFPQTLLSYLGPLAALCASVVLLRHSQSKTKWTITKWGLFAGGYLFVILQAFVIGVHWQEILDDGVAYWIFVNLPSFYLSIPCCLIGAFIGWMADLIKNRRSKRLEAAGVPPHP